LIRDTRTTPFNTGQRIELHDFTEGEAVALARGLNFDEKTAAGLLRRIHHWTNGHPYLTQRLCQAIAESNPQSQSPDPQSIDRLCEQMFFSPRAQERDDNLLFVRERMLRGEVDLAGLLHLYERVLRGKRARDDETDPLVSALRLSGIARVENGRLRERNRIYARVFDCEWVRANMPDAEVRRQRTAFRRGLLRAAVVAAVIIAAMAALALFAVKQRDAAEQARAEALSRELAANAIVHLPQDPELSVLLAIEALRVAPTTQAEDALRQSLPESHVQAVMRGHTDAVSSAAFSPDGKWMVTAGFDRTARVWEASTGRGVAELRGHTDRVWGAAFSPDGQRVVTASEDGAARIWEVSDGRSLVELRGHTDRVDGASFSPDGKLVVTASWDKTARIWEAGTGRSLTVLRGHTDRVSGAAFSPDGQWVVTGSYDSTARVWEANAGRLARELRGHKAYVTGVAFSPDGQFVVAASVDGTARVWKAGTGQIVAQIRGHSDEVWSAAFSPNGKYPRPHARDAGPDRRRA
jgi:hypothetical protein